MSAKSRKNKKVLSPSKREVKRHKSKMPLPVEKKGIRPISRGREKQKNVKKQSPKPITGRRLWLFRIIVIVVFPALLFLLVESALRVGGYGFTPAAFIKAEVEGKEYYYNNPEFGWWFFPKSIARKFELITFPANKPEDTYRVFVLGASAALGEPDQAFSFGRILQVMLQQEYPGVNFEVITAAMTAINSHVVLKIAEDCARHDPDLFVVYLGNNEVVGPYGAATVFAPFSSRLSLIRLGIALKATRLGQLLTSLLETVTAEKNAPRTWRGLEMFLEEQIRPDNPNLQKVYQHFQKNLEDIIRIGQKTEIPMIFCTVGSNLKDSPPFASLHRSDLTEPEKEKWNGIYQQGIADETEGKYAEAVEHYLKAAEIDDSYADLQFRLGRCYWAMARYDQAKQRYIQARELDTLRFRADNRINEVIRDVAVDKAAQGVYLTDVAKVLEETSPYQTPGEEIFYEHVHFNFKGNYLLAKTVFEQVQQILPERIKTQKNVIGPMMTRLQCAQYLAYSDWDRCRIAGLIIEGHIKHAPFTNQLYHNERLKRMEQEFKDLKASLTAESLQDAALQYSQVIQNTPHDRWFRRKYAELLSEGLNDYPAAAKQYQFLLNDFPYDYVSYIKLGILSNTQGNTNAAIDYSLKAIEIMPTSAEAYFNIGFAYQLQERVAKAIEHYSAALRFGPFHAQSLNNLGMMLVSQRKFDEAIGQFRKALQITPNSTRVLINLSNTLAMQGNLKDAISYFYRVIEIEPGNAGAHYNLGLALASQRKTDEAISHYRRALEINPEYADVHANLGIVLASRGKLDEAISHFKQALQIRPDHAEARHNLRIALSRQRK